jgi:hypothetical protein
LHRSGGKPCHINLTLQLRAAYKLLRVPELALLRASGHSANARQI